jgi:hypothetical protein
MRKDCEQATRCSGEKVSQPALLPLDHPVASREPPHIAGTRWNLL